MTDAPTTRETADHAELLLMANASLEIYTDDVLVVGGTRRIHGDNIILAVKNGVDRLIANEAALLSEIAALRGDLAKTERDYSELRDSYDAVVAKLTIERSHGTKQSVRATQAERQRDELRKALERLASSEAFETPRVIDGPLAPEMRARLDYARQALATQGADQ